MYLKNISPGTGSEGALIQNVNFNLDATGTTPLGTNMQTGACLENCTNVTLGSATEGNINAFVAIGSNAVEVDNSSGVVIQQNHFGTPLDVSTPFPNGGDNILVGGSSGTVSIVGNSIRNAGANGVNVASTNVNAVIRFNHIVGQNGNAIRRAAHSASSAIANAARGSTSVEGTVAGSPSEELILDFYAYDPLSVNPEADLYIGSATVNLDSGGFGSYAELFPVTAPRGWKITSTVTTDLQGTSELSVAAPIELPLDTDGDGLPDAWENLFTNCLDAAVADPPNEDCDGDGHTNLEEFIAGTDPTVMDARTVGSPVVASGGITIQVPSTGGRRYTLQRADSLGESAMWSVLDSVYAPTNGVVALVDSDIRNTSAYRVVIQEE